jgi:hypothetical protein
MNSQLNIDNNAESLGLPAIDNALNFIQFVIERPNCCALEELFVSLLDFLSHTSNRLPPAHRGAIITMQ